MTKLLILSDLHNDIDPLPVEHEGVRIDRDADVVVLAGDIDEGVGGLFWARTNFPDKPIVYVAGNHEYYDGHWTRTLQALRDKAQELDIHFLENDSVTLAGVRFLGCTFWTDFELFGALSRHHSELSVKRRLTDYVCIQADIVRNETLEVEPYYGPVRLRSLDTEDTRQRHLQSRYWLREQLKSSEADPLPTVVVTHHAPSHESLLPRYKGDLVSSAYASNCEWMVDEDNCALWIHGHVHNSLSYKINGTSIASNPRGYFSWMTEENENKEFVPNRIVEVLPQGDPS